MSLCWRSALVFPCVELVSAQQGFTLAAISESLAHLLGPSRVATTSHWKTDGCSTERSWIPQCNAYVRKSGLESACFGVWTREWSATYNHSQLTELNDVLSPELKNVVAKNECPYGRVLPGQVTWPDPPEELKGVVAGRDLSKIIAVVYSYIPYIVGFMVGVHTVVHIVRGLWRGQPPISKVHLNVLAYLLVLLFLLEKVLKLLISDPRPGMLLQNKDYHGRYVGSCINSCGMPSSHAALGMSWFMLIFFDAVHKVKHSTPHTRLQRLQRMGELFKLEPWVAADEIETWDFLIYTIFWGFLLVPVPFMRVVLRDHTESQVLCGMFVGVVFVSVWRWLLRRVRRMPQPEVLNALLKDDLPPMRSAIETAAAELEGTSMQQTSGRPPASTALP